MSILSNVLTFPILIKVSLKRIEGLAPHKTYPQSWVIARSHSELHSDKTGKLWIESSGVSIVVTARISALIGQSDNKPNYRLNTCTSLGRAYELWFGHCLCGGLGPLPLNFGGKWKWLSLQSIRVHLHNFISLSLEFQLFSDCCTVDLGGLYTTKPYLHFWLNRDFWCQRKSANFSYLRVTKSYATLTFKLRCLSHKGIFAIFLLSWNGWQVFEPHAILFSVLWSRIGTSYYGHSSIVA